MKAIPCLLFSGVLMATVEISFAELPAPSAEQKAAAKAKAEKDKIEKEKSAKEVAGAQDKAVANYRKNRGSSAAGADAQPAPRQNSSARQEQQSSSPRKADPSQGADHSNAGRPDSELTRQEAQTEMPKPGQVNDYSTPARDPQNSSGRK